MRTLTTIHDPIYEGSREYSAVDRFFLSLIRDERDLPFIYLTIKITLTLVPLAVALYLTAGWVWWVLFVAYHYFNNIVFKGPFGLMLHCTSHRKFFRAEYEWLNKYLPWVVGPLFGQTPETYYSHHIHMHHAENNLPDDLSTTMTYQRDSKRDFLRYFTLFFFEGVVDLVNYFRLRNRQHLVRKVVVGEITFIVMCIALSFVNFPATLAVFILPFLLSRIVMMMGNWTQHAFIDARDPGNPYLNSVTCINTPYNHKCWNDGYHISHHQKPHMHWTQHPVMFRRTIDQYAEHQAIVFEKLDFLRIFFRLMRKDYDGLADYLVNVNNCFASREEAVALIKQRTRPIVVVDEQQHQFAYAQPALAS